MYIYTHMYVHISLFFCIRMCRTVFNISISMYSFVYFFIKAFVCVQLVHSRRHRQKPQNLQAAGTTLHLKCDGPKQGSLIDALRHRQKSPSKGP